MVQFHSGGQAPYIEEGWYTATIQSIESRESQNPQYPAPQVVWHFELEGTDGPVLDDRGIPVDFWVFSSESVGPKSNARPMVEALAGQSLIGMTDEEATQLVEACAEQHASCQVKIGDYLRPDGEFGGSRAIKGSWLPLDAPRPGQRQTATRPAATPVARPGTAAQAGQRVAAARRGVSSPPPDGLDGIPF